MRKRSEANQETLGGMAEKPIPAKAGHRYPIEDDFSAMCIELKARGFVLGVSDVSHWAPEVRHLVAMYLEHDLSEDDIPEAIKRFKPKPSAESVIADVGGQIDTVIKEAAQRRGSDDPGKERKEALAVEDRRGAGDNGTSLPQIADGKSVELIAGMLLRQDSEEAFTIGWGAEKFFPFPGNYSSFEAARISVTVSLKPGEDKIMRMRAEYELLEKLGEELRERKRLAFLRAIGKIKDDEKK